MSLRPFAVSGLVTAGLYAAGRLDFWGLGFLVKVDQFGGAVFAGWLGGLLGFCLFGIVVAVVSLIKPESAEFDARARILFRAQSGQHIEYIIDRMKNVFEHYAKKSKIIVIFERHDETQKVFYVTETQKTAVRNYIEDISSEYDSRLHMAEVTPPPAGGEPNKIAFLRIYDKMVYGPEEFGTEILKAFKTVINRTETRRIVHCVKVWFRADEESIEYTPVRYTQRLSLRVCNNLRVAVKLKIEVGGHTTERTVSSGGREKLLDLSDLEPNKVAYKYTASAVLPAVVP